MGTKKENVVFHTRNKHGVRIARCCMSCAFKEESELKTIRVCSLDKLPHHRYHMCRDWQASQTMEGAGTSGGRIKRREYLMYVLAIRYEEQLAEEKGQEIVPRSVEEIRDAFEQEHGSVFLN